MLVKYLCLLFFVYTLYILEPSRISSTERFCENSYRLLAIDYFRKNGPPWMFDWVLSTPLKQVCLSIFQSLILFVVLFQRPPYWCWCTVCITVWHHLTMVTVGEEIEALSGDHLGQLPNSISACDVIRSCYMLSLLLFVLLLLVWLVYFSFLLLVFFFSFHLYLFRDSNLISLNTVEFRYYVAIITLVNFGKPEAIRN